MPGLPVFCSWHTRATRYLSVRASRAWSGPAMMTTDQRGCTVDGCTALSCTVSSRRSASRQPYGLCSRISCKKLYILWGPGGYHTHGCTTASAHEEAQG